MSALVLDVANFFHGLYNIFRRIGSYAAHIPLVGDELESFFQDVADLFWDAYYSLFRFARSLEDFEDYVKAAIDKVDIIISYVLDELSDKVKDFFDSLQDINRKVSELWGKLHDVPEMIGNWLDEYTRTLWKLVEDYVTDFVTAFTSSGSDLLDGIHDYVNSLAIELLSDIAAPVNLVNQWFQDIEDFFNDPWTWLWEKLDDFMERYW